MTHPFIPASLVACIAPALAADAWLTDIDAGKKQAAAENKAVLIEFTGSDWCQPCMKLRKNVTGTKEFETYAGKNYVLVEIDLARYKKDRPELYKKNREIYNSYNQRSVPCIFIMDPSGNITARLGGSANNEAMKNTLETAFRQNREFHTSLAAAEKLTGNARIQALAKLYTAVPENNRHNYKPLFNRLLELDKNDISGLVAAEHRQKEQAALSNKIQADLMSTKEPAALIKKIDGYLAQPNMPPELHALLFERKFHAALALAQTEQDIDNALSIADDMAKSDPKHAQNILRMKEAMQKDKAGILRRIKQQKPQ